MGENFLDPLMKKRKSKIPYITISVIAINVIVFILMEILGSTESVEYMLAHGALSYDTVVVKGEYYRLLTSFFMHFGFEHLVNNIVVLGVTGYYLENILKRGTFATIYMLSGLLSGAASMFWHHMINDYCVSAGASGAIFGLTGALVFIIITNRTIRRSVGIPRFIIFFLLIFYNGRVNAEIDNAAHIAGFIIGFAIMALISLIKKNSTRGM